MEAVAFSLLGPPFWDGKLCFSSVALPWPCCGNLMCLSCDCYPTLRRRRGAAFGPCFCSSAKARLTRRLSSSVSDHFCRSSFLSSFLLLSISVLVTHLMHTHADCWSVCSALRVAWISFRSLNGGLSSWHIWHLGFEWAVFGLLVFFTQQWGDTLVLEYSHLPGCSFYIGTRHWACTQASILYS